MCEKSVPRKCVEECTACGTVLGYSLLDIPEPGSANYIAPSVQTVLAFICENCDDANVQLGEDNGSYLPDPLAEDDDFSPVSEHSLGPKTSTERSSSKRAERGAAQRGRCSADDPL